MMFCYDGKIHQIVVAVIIHCMGVPHGTVVYIARGKRFLGFIILEMAMTTDAEDDF